MAAIVPAVAVDFAFGDVIAGIGVLWVPAIVVVYAVAAVHASIGQFASRTFNVDNGRGPLAE